MFYRLTIEDHVRVAPKLFGHEIKDALLKSVRTKYDGIIDQALGVIVDVGDIREVGEGNIIPGDGAAYYKTTFELITFRPELQEVVVGKIKDIADFGAFLTLGPIDGMIHISQTMDDFVSFAKEKTLTGRDSKHILKTGDFCRARIIAVSFKDVTNPKIGLTMRQPSLGKLDWIEEENTIPEKTTEKKTEKKK